MFCTTYPFLPLYELKETFIVLTYCIVFRGRSLTTGLEEECSYIWLVVPGFENWAVRPSVSRIFVQNWDTSIGWKCSRFLGMILSKFTILCMTFGYSESLFRCTHLHAIAIETKQERLSQKKPCACSMWPEPVASSFWCVGSTFLSVNNLQKHLKSKSKVCLNILVWRHLWIMQVFTPFVYFDPFSGVYT